MTHTVLVKTTGDSPSYGEVKSLCDADCIQDPNFKDVRALYIIVPNEDVEDYRIRMNPHWYI
jgi:hypothetical protein